MTTKRSKIILASAVMLVLVTSVMPRSIYGIRNFSLAREAQAQRGGGIMQSIMPIMMLMMLMNMMQQNKGNQLQREQAQAAKNANSNLIKAGQQPSRGVTEPGVTNPSTNPITNPGNPITNPGTNPITNPGTNPITNPNSNPMGIFRPK